MPHWRKALTNPQTTALQDRSLGDDRRALKVHVSGLVCESI